MCTHNDLLNRDYTIDFDSNVLISPLVNLSMQFGKQRLGIHVCVDMFFLTYTIHFEQYPKATPTWPNYTSGKVS